MRRMVTVAISLVVLVGAALAALSSTALQRRLIFVPEVLPPDEVFHFAVPHNERFFDTPSGHRLHAVALRPQQDLPPRGRAVLYLHGNAGSVRDWGHVGADVAVVADAVVYVVDYAGYGKSTGSLSEATLLADVAAVYDAIANDHDDVVVFGRSIGTGPAVHLASTKTPSALLLETPYASLVDMKERHFGWMPTPLMAFTLRSDHWLPQVRCPVHVFHGTADTLIPLASMERLLSSRPGGLPAGSSVTVVDGGGHNDLSRFSAYREALAAALATTSTAPGG